MGISLLKILSLIQQSNSRTLRENSARVQTYSKDQPGSIVAEELFTGSHFATSSRSGGGMSLLQGPGLPLKADAVQNCAERQLGPRDHGNCAENPVRLGVSDG
jgi:hypothetical protein